MTKSSLVRYSPAVAVVTLHQVTLVVHLAGYSQTDSLALSCRNTLQMSEIVVHLSHWTRLDITACEETILLLRSTPSGGVGGGSSVVGRESCGAVIRKAPATDDGNGSCLCRYSIWCFIFMRFFLFSLYTKKMVHNCEINQSDLVHLPN